MLCSLNHPQDITLHGYTKLKLSLLIFEELNMGNDDLSMNSEYNNRSNINFPLHYALNQIYLNTDLVDEVILTKSVLRPTKKQRSVGPHKSILKKNGNTKYSCVENKKFRSVNKSLYGIHVDFDNYKEGLRTTTTPIIHKQRQEELSTHGYWYIYSNIFLEAYEELITHY